MREINPIDAKILTDLLENGRKSLTEIAEECGETKVTICKRFKEMKKLGIIIGSTIQLNYARLGYNTVGDISFNAQPDNIDRLISNIERIPNIYGASKINNNTVSVVATLRNVDELNRLIEIIKGQPTVSDVITNIWMGIRNMPYNLNIYDYEVNHCSKQQYTQKSDNASIEIDSVDRQIIDKLVMDGRKSFANIADELDVSTNTVIRKYEKLKNHKIISTSIQINPLKLGYEAGVGFALAFQNSGNLSSIIDNLSAIPDVTLLVKTNGRYELFVTSFIKNVKQIVDFRDKIFKIGVVSKWEMYIDRPYPCYPSRKQYISTL